MNKYTDPYVTNTFTTLINKKLHLERCFGENNRRNIYRNLAPLNKFCVCVCNVINLVLIDSCFLKNDC